MLLIRQDNQKIYNFIKLSYRMEVQEPATPLIIGYYPFRAKAQIIRLLCEYLSVPYYDRFLNPDEWSRFKEGDGKRWLNKELPFLKHGDFILTGTNAIINYVIEVSGQTELLGKTLNHQIKIDAFRSRGCLTIILGFLCNNRVDSDQLKMQRRKQLNELYERKIAALLELHEQECCPNSFYFGYITLIDFAIYEIMNYFRLLFSKEVGRFPKLMQLRQRVASLPEIHNYETSHRAVVDYCPIRYFKRFKEEKIWARRQRSESLQTQQASVDLENN